MARSTRRKKPLSSRPRKRGARSASGARWPVLAAGLALAAAALFALLSWGPEAPREAIDEASRAQLESVLRDARD